MDLEVRIIKLGDIFVSIFQDFERLLATWEINVDQGHGFRRVRVFFHKLLVFVNVEISAEIADDVRDDKVDLDKSNEDTEPGILFSSRVGLRKTM